MPLSLSPDRERNAGTPRWSPDGTKIAFDWNADGNWNIYVIRSSGGKPVRLTSDPASEVIPSWSRDGKWIYFASTRSGRNEVWKAPADGGDAVQVTKNGGWVAFESADGASLYYTKDRLCLSAPLENATGRRGGAAGIAGSLLPQFLRRC